jgi:hypothetical protein
MGIRSRQNEPSSIELMAAQRQMYRRAKRAWLARVTGSTGLAMAAVPVALFAKDLGVQLGVAGFVWLVITRVVLRPYEGHQNKRAAAVQEQFDVYVLDLPPNKKFDPPGALVTAAAARRHFARDDAERRAALTDWYGDPEATHRPYDVLMCQRANLDWSSRLHGEWTAILIVGVIAWVLIGTGASLVAGLTLSKYLVSVLVPAGPALVDGIDTVNSYRQHKDRRSAVEVRARKLWATGMTGAPPVTLADCRDLQDEIFELRRVEVWVPDWFYELRKTTYERDMQAATRALVQEARQHGLG